MDWNTKSTAEKVSLAFNSCVDGLARETAITERPFQQEFSSSGRFSFFCDCRSFQDGTQGCLWTEPFALEGSS